MDIITLAALVTLFVLFKTPEQPKPLPRIVNANGVQYVADSGRLVPVAEFLVTEYGDTAAKKHFPQVFADTAQ